jgi:hypothetical protein
MRWRNGRGGLVVVTHPGAPSASPRSARLIEVKFPAVTLVACLIVSVRPPRA